MSASVSHSSLCVSAPPPPSVSSCVSALSCCSPFRGSVLSVRPCRAVLKKHATDRAKMVTKGGSKTDNAAMTEVDKLLADATNKHPGLKQPSKLANTCLAC